jgi:HD-like signal output (HDOD) protein
MPPPPRDLESWVRHLSRVDIPVLQATARELARLREEAPDLLDPRHVAQVLARDPMMTVKLLRHLQRHRFHGRRVDVVHVEQALMMLGMDPFFVAVPAEPLVEEALAAHPEALLAMLKVVRRAQRASSWAMDWAARRQDVHFDEVRIAALLHDLGEMLMWCFEPSRMLEIRSRQERDRTLRSRDAQQAVLGFTLADLQRALAREWGLPELLLRLMDDDSRGHDRVRNVALAVDLARHSAHGWDDAALPDDYRGIAEFLHTKPEAVPALVGAPASDGQAPS